MSKLVAVELQNFMSIESARLEFDETGILNITGYNDSGKSAITRSLEVLFYDAYSSDQVNFIQDDKDYFGVGVEFDDGVSINKYKYSNGKSVWEMLKGDQVLFTNRLADGIAAMATIPEPIAQYLGVLKDEFTDEQLNVRRNTDRLFLINTTGGDNYKIINSVLHCDVLAESVKRMNEDRNKLQSEVTSKATSVNTLKGELESIVVLDDNAVIKVETLSKNLRDSKQRSEYLLSIDNQQRILNDIHVYDELPTIDTTRISEIKQLQSLKETSEVPIYNECTTIDYSRLSALEEINSLRLGLDIPIYEELPVVDSARFTAVREIAEAFNNLWQAENNLNQVEQEHQSTLTQLTALSQQYDFKICKSCGTLVE